MQDCIGYEVGHVLYPLGHGGQLLQLVRLCKLCRLILDGFRDLIVSIEDPASACQADDNREEK